MSGTLKSKDETIEVHLSDKPGIVEIEFQQFKNVAIDIRLIDSTVDRTIYKIPKGAIYLIDLYKLVPNAKLRQIEYDYACVMPNGKIIHRKDIR